MINGQHAVWAVIMMKVCPATEFSEVLLPSELSSGRSARGFVEEHWCTTHGGGDHSNALLLVTELIINAVRYGRPPIAFGLECTGRDGLLVWVSDGSGEHPVLREVEPASLGGRGVRLVDLLSVEWGVKDCVVTGGKTVWCRLLT